MVIGMISARGGSTRVPRKNLAIVAGYPLVAWSIIQARSSRMLDAVFLTTDDDEIAEVGKRYGATVLRRPKMDDGVTVGVPFRMALEQIESSGFGPIDAILSILPTSPLRKPDHFDRMIATWMDTGGLVTTACPQKETFVFKLDDPFQDRFQTYDMDRSFDAHQLLGDKFWNYCRLFGGESIQSRDDMMREWSTNPDLDFEIDTKPVNTARWWHFVPVEEWQMCEVDYPADLELCRVLMEHYIKTPDIYLRYKEND